jgi:hypothetical protein
MGHPSQRSEVLGTPSQVSEVRPGAPAGQSRAALLESR